MKSLETRQTLLTKVLDQRDDSAWEEFVQYYELYLNNVLVKYGLNPDDSKDIIQMTLLKIWELLPKFEYDSSRGRFRSWITQININIMKDYVKKNARLSKAINEGKITALDTESPKINEIYEQEWRQLIAQKAWEKVAADLNSNVKTCFELYMTGTPNKDIAEQLNISESSVRVYQNRVRLKLNQELANIEREYS